MGDAFSSDQHGDSVEALKNLAPGLFLLAAILMGIVGVRTQQGKTTPRRITIYAILFAVLGFVGIFGPGQV